MPPRNRRTTPSAQAAVAASTAPVQATRTRATRSRTHEVEPKPATQPAPRRAARQANAENDASSNNRASRSRRRVAQSQALETLDLTTVKEQSEDEELDEAELEEQMEMPEPDESEPRATLFRDVYDRSFQTISGTTALSDAGLSDGASSIDEGEAVDAKTFITYGEDVYNAAINLLRLFDQHKPRLEQILKAIDNPNSTIHRKFKQKCEGFNFARAELGGLFREPGFFSASSVMDKLFGALSLPPRTSEFFHVLEVVQLINLAGLGQTIASASPDAELTATVLVGLDTIFPQPFLTNINMPESNVKLAGYSSYMDETFDVALALRVQAAVMEIQQNLGEESFDINETLQRIFYASPGSEDTLRCWDFNSLGSGDLGLLPEFETKMRKQIRWLKLCVQDKEDAMEKLAKNFPWADFRTSMMRWAKIRMEELAGLIDLDGGIYELMRNLRDELKPELTKNPSFDTAATVVGTPSPAKRKQRVVTRRHEVRESTVIETASSPLRSTAGNAARPRQSRGNTAEFQPLEDIEASVEADAKRRMERWKEAEKQKKENMRTVAAGSSSRGRSFIDQQDNAERIEHFDEEGTQASQNQPVQRSLNINRRQKRPRQDGEEYEDEDMSEDEGFQEDNRDIDMSQRRLEAPLPPSRASRSSNGPSPKRVRIAAPPRLTPVGEDENSDEPPPQHRLTQDQANRVSSQGKRAGHQKARQTRKTWSAAEEEYFTDLIAEHGTSWSLIKQMDGEDLLADRDQVALKDKARNMKTSMILAGVRLPMNFENIPLDQKAIKRLVAAGIYDYDPETGRCLDRA